MKKKLFGIILSVLMPVTIFTGCADIVNYYDRIDTVIEMTEDMITLYNEGKIELTDKIHNGNVADYCDIDSKLYNILTSDNEFGDYYIVLVNEYVSLVRTNEIFGEAEGFVVNTAHENLGDTYIVPEHLGFKNNKISLITVDNYDNVYTFRAKL